MITVEKLTQKLNMDVAAGQTGITTPINLAQITRPGLELAGMFEFYEQDRIQLIGSKEITFFWWLSESDQDIRVKMMFEKLPPAFIFSKHADIPDVFIKYGNKFNVPVLKSQQRTNELFSAILQILSEALAPRTSIHGTLVDINGVGVLIRGKSGIGKSEVALELVRRGHQLVADDRVDVYESTEGIIVGEAPAILQKYLEIRGIGIVNVVQLFGASAFKESKRIMVIVDLLTFENTVDYDRLGLEDVTERIFNTNIPNVKIPITAARSVPTLVEVAAMNARLKHLGTNMAKEFSEKLTQNIQEKSKQVKKNNK
jgi:HPr kinase/phosphorylase